MTCNAVTYSTVKEKVLYINTHFRCNYLKLIEVTDQQMQVISLSNFQLVSYDLS